MGCFQCKPNHDRLGSLRADASAGTASASLPRQGVCRRCPQRTVLVGLH